MANSPPCGYLGPTLLTLSSLSGSHPIVLPAISWCYHWTGRLPLEGRVGFASGLRALHGLRHPGLDLLYFSWVFLGSGSLGPQSCPLQALGLCPQFLLSNTTERLLIAALDPSKGLGLGCHWYPSQWPHRITEN